MPVPNRRLRRPVVGKVLVGAILVACFFGVWHHLASFLAPNNAAYKRNSTSRSLNENFRLPTKPLAVQNAAEQTSPELTTSLAAAGALSDTLLPPQMKATLEEYLTGDEIGHKYLDDGIKQDVQAFQTDSITPQQHQQQERLQEDLKRQALPNIMAVVSTYDDDLDWLLDDSNTETPILQTTVYQIAHLGITCKPVFPRLPNVLSPDSVSALPDWPQWAKGFIREKCGMKHEAEPMSVFDVERRARLEAGLPWGNRAAGVQMQARRRGLQEDSIISNGHHHHRRKVTQSNQSHELHQGEEGAAPDKLAPLRERFGILHSNQGFTEANRSHILTIPSVSPIPLHIIPEMGRESMAYLTFIIDNYENLPEMMLFMHGHDHAWHAFPLGQSWVLKRVRNLGPRNLTMGFMQLGCFHREESFLHPRVVDANYQSANGIRWKESMTGHYVQAWLEHLGDAFGVPLPHYVQAACCATFAASREAVLRRPKGFYEGLRHWLLRTGQDKYWAGVAIEFSWHAAFTGMFVYDPPVEQCRRELYDI